MTKIEDARLELECAQRGLTAMLEHQEECKRRLRAADKAVSDAITREQEATFALRSLDGETPAPAKEG